MAKKGPEYFEVQRPAIELLCSRLNYAYADGESEAFLSERDGISEAVLRGRLERAVKRINPGLPDAGVQAAMNALLHPEGATLIEINEAVHTMLSRWVTVKVPGKHGEEGRSVRFIDYDNPANNEFLVVEEFRVKRKSAAARASGEETSREGVRRTDLTVFINGIPVAVIECKEPGKEHGIKLAIDQLNQYQREDEVPQLFAFCHFTVVTNRGSARFGTIGTPHKYYESWNDPYPLTRDQLFTLLGRNPTAQDVLLAGLFAKDNLLDLLRNYAVFEVKGGRKIKKVARYQQYQGVNEALARIRGEMQAGVDYGKKPLRERGGVIWHTQGSGKSLTMLWLAVKIRRESRLKNPTILLVTDRRDLDRQLHKTFQNCGFENPVRAVRVAELRKFLAGGAGQTISTTVFKFRKTDMEQHAKQKMPVLSEADNIIALVDEAHRTESGLFAAQMKAALPNVCRVAFTATPLTKKERKTTVGEFGQYIHKYTMRQSEADGATVPIYYEARHSELAVWRKGKLEPLFEAEFSDLTPEQRREIRKREVTEENVALAESRIEQIAYDIYEHYTKYIEPNGFKAQVAACCQRGALRYYNALSNFPALHGRIAVIISEPSRDEPDIIKLHEQFKNNEEDIIDQFVNGSLRQLAILIVVDRLLTGFDAPVEQVLYLDKRLRDHGLLQAVARVNRKGEGRYADAETGEEKVVEKEYGLVVDYWGVTEYLNQALASFDRHDIGEPMSPRATLDAIDDLKQAHRDVMSFFDAGLGRKSTEKWVDALAAEDVRAHFRLAYGRFVRMLDRLLPDQAALPYLDDASWLEKVKRNARVQYEAEDLALVDSSAKVRRLIDLHVKTESVVQMLEPTRITSDKFRTEIEKLSSVKAKAERILHATRKEISVRREEDPAFFTSMEKRLEEIITNWKQGRLEDIESFKKLQSIQKEVVTHKTSSESALAGILASIQAGTDKEVREPESAYGKSDHEKLAAELLEALKPYTQIVDWAQKNEVQRQMRRELKQRLRKAGLPEEKIDEVVLAIMEYAVTRMSG